MIAAICACSSSKKATVAKQTEYPRIADDFTDGETIIKRSDCLTCHREIERSIGPAFTSIANKYKYASDTIKDKLSQKIRIGGPGSWGTVPMAPHPGLSKANADSIVKYILLKYN